MDMCIHGTRRHDQSLPCDDLCRCTDHHVLLNARLHVRIPRLSDPIDLSALHTDVGFVYPRMVDNECVADEEV